MGEKVPLLARAVGGKVLGPRPGRAIISFWQGIVEIVLRAVALAVAVCAVVPSAVALTKIQGLSPIEQAIVKIAGDNLLPIGRAGSALVLVAAAVGLILEVLFITLRFLNVGIINYKIRIVLFVDFGITVGVAVGLLVASIVAGYGSQQWNSKLGSADPYKAIHISLAASAAIGILAVGVFSGLAVWLLLFALYKWNKSVVTYTLKDAIVG